MRTHARALAAAVVILVLGLVACGGDDDGGDDAEASDATDSETPTATADETTTTAPDTPEELAVTAYQASWDATFRALNPPRELPELAQLLTGEALSERINGIAGRARQGHYVVGSVTTHPTVVSATEHEVLLDDCVVENSIEYDAAGQVVDPAENVQVNYRVTVINEAGVWKVSDFERREESCVPG
jgi:hypothetical protein